MCGDDNRHFYKYIDISLSIYIRVTVRVTLCACVCARAWWWASVCVRACARARVTVIRADSETTTAKAAPHTSAACWGAPVGVLRSAFSGRRAPFLLHYCDCGIIVRCNVACDGCNCGLLCNRRSANSTERFLRRAAVCESCADVARVAVQMWHRSRCRCGSAGIGLGQPWLGRPRSRARMGHVRAEPVGRQWGPDGRQILPTLPRADVLRSLRGVFGDDRPRAG